MKPAVQTRLLKIAERLDAEARTWQDCFAAWDGKTFSWSKEDEWAHVRWFKLKSDAEFLRKLCQK